RYLVRLVLAFGYLPAKLLYVLAFEQAAQRFRARQRHFGVALEKIEKPLFFGHQGPKPAEHERLALHAMVRPRMVPDHAWIKPSTSACRVVRYPLAFNIEPINLPAQIACALRVRRRPRPSRYEDIAELPGIGTVD